MAQWLLRSVVIWNDCVRPAGVASEYLYENATSRRVVEYSLNLKYDHIDELCEWSKRI